MAHVLILTLVFPPDSVSTAQIMGELAVDLKHQGHAVTVITTYPHYNRSPENEKSQPLHSYWAGLLWKSDYAGIPVYHTLMPPKSGRKLWRALAWLVFHLLSTVAGMSLVRKPDVIFAPSPPLTIGLSAWILARFHRAHFIYNVQEIYPDILIRMGVIRNAGLIGALYKLEKFIYRCASRVTTIAPNMGTRLRQKGVPADKIAIIPNFVDTNFFRPLDKENDFSRKYNLPDQFVVSYAGNMGPAQGLEHFVEAANLLRNEAHISFLMMGDGILRAELARRAQQLGLPNLIFLPYQPYALMPQIYAASDLSLVPLAPETGGDAVPSKVYRIMACRRALLVAADHGSDLAALVRDVGCGILVEPGAPRALANAIREAARCPDDLKEMGRKAYDYALKYYARPVVTGQYDLLIREIRGTH